MRLIWLGLCLLMGALSVLATPEAAKPIACDPLAALKATPLFAGARQLRKAPADSGVMNPNALYATLSGGKVSVAVAIDTTDKDPAAKGCLRLDFTGAGKFTRDSYVELKKLPGDAKTQNYEFGPKAFTADINGKPVSISVRGNYQIADKIPLLTVMLATAVQGTCDFRGNSHATRLIDGNGNLMLGDTTSILGNQYQPQGFTLGDTLLIDAGAGTFADPIKTFCGQPVLVEGEWYSITYNQDTGAFTAKWLNLPTGKLRHQQPAWAAILTSGKMVIALTGDQRDVELPVGQYRIAYYLPSPVEPIWGWVPTLPSNITQQATITANSSTSLSVADPVVVTISTRGVFGSGDTRFVPMELMLHEPDGSQPYPTRLPNGQQLALPTFEVIDMNGKRISEISFSYG